MLSAPAPWYVSAVRTRHNSMPVLQIISEPTGEVIALVPYSDRTTTAHAECYADANLIASAPAFRDELRKMQEYLRNIKAFSTDEAAREALDSVIEHVERALTKTEPAQ